MIKKWNIKVKKEISNKSLKQKPKTKVSGKTTKKTKTVKSSCKLQNETLRLLFERKVL